MDYSLQLLGRVVWETPCLRVPIDSVDCLPNPANYWASSYNGMFIQSSQNLHPLSLTVDVRLFFRTIGVNHCMSHATAIIREARYAVSVRAGSHDLISDEGQALGGQDVGPS